jgi:hypothetical protein
MGKAARKRKPPRPAGSLTRNIALLIMSVAILAGATWLFINTVDLPDIKFNISELKPGEILSTIKSKFGKKEIDDRHIAKSEKKKGKVEASVSDNEYKYSFYDILFHQKQPKSADSRYSILIEQFKSKKSAQEYAKALEKDKRLTCRIERKGGKYAVVWGGFPASSDAERYNKLLSMMLDMECEVVEM